MTKELSSLKLDRSITLDTSFNSEAELMVDAISFFKTKIEIINSILYWDTPYENELTGIDRKYISILSENQRHIYRHYSALYTEKIKKEEISEDEFKRKDYSYRLYLRLLLVTDYLSGMTDSFIKTLYQELMGID